MPHHTRHARLARSKAPDPYRSAGLAAAPRAPDRLGRRLRRPGTQPGSAQTGKPRNSDLPQLATCPQRRWRHFAGDPTSLPGRRHRCDARHRRARCQRPLRPTRDSSASEAPRAREPWREAIFSSRSGAGLTQRHRVRKGGNRGHRKRTYPRERSPGNNCAERVGDGRLRRQPLFHARLRERL